MSESFDDMKDAEEKLNCELYKIQDLYDASLGKKSSIYIHNPFIFDDTKNKSYNHHIQEIVNNPKWQAARMVILEELKSYSDADGNFLEQFQTTGFDQRLWELYLNSYFREEEFKISKYPDIDFVLEKSNQVLGVEAVTVACKTNSICFFPNRISKELYSKIFLEYSSALTTKLKKMYWNKKYIENKPLLLAIENFSGSLELIGGINVLCDYLYGIEPDSSRKTFKVHKGEDVRKSNGSTVETGFFNLPEAENISAVISTTQGTLPKFNRIGIYRGYAPINIRCLQYVAEYNRKPDATLPRPVVRIVCPGENSETWGEGITMFHNPNARNKFSKALFGEAAHVELKGDYVVSHIPDFFSFNSITMTELD